MNELINSVYPLLNQRGVASLNYLTERIILAPRNDAVNSINATVLDVFPGETMYYFAADKMMDEDANNPTNINRYPNEYLNSLNPTGLPLFALTLKVGCPIILLRNIVPKDGLCNCNTPIFL